MSELPVNAETLVSLAMGLGLSAACGFRVFVPLLAAGAASRMGFLALSPGFQWMETTPALIAFGTATVLEVLAYYVPWLDHLLDILATPAAVIAGIVASAAVFVDVPPLVRWSVALIGGGTAAGLVQGATVLLRLKSTALSAGLANPVVSTGELAGAVLASVLAIVLPAVCLILLAVCLVVVFRSFGRLLPGSRSRRFN
jgi:uncharacterized protein DUF4126